MRIPAAPALAAFLVLFIYPGLTNPGPLFAENGYYRQGKIHFGARQYDQAFDYFQKALRAEPSNGNPLFYMGYIQEQQNRRGEAVESYRRAVDLRMDRDLREKAFWKIVLHYKFIQDWENLYVYSEKFLKYNDSKSVRQLHDLASEKRDPRMARVTPLMREAAKDRKAGRFHEAADNYRRALNIKSDHHPARWELALIEMKLKQYRSAERHLRSLMSSTSPRWEYFYKAAICNYHIENYSQALRDLEAARRKNDDPDDSFVYYVNLAEGLIRLEENQAARAREVLSEANKKKSTPRVQGALARALWDTGDYGDAHNLARRALKSEPRQEDALLVDVLALIREQKSQAFTQSKLLLDVVNAELAEDREGEAAPPQYTPALLYLGRTAGTKRDWTLAISVYERVHMKRLQSIYEAERRANSKENSLRDYNYHYGAALYHAGRLPQAIVTLRRVDDSPAANFMIAQAYAQQEDERNSREWLKRAADADESYWKTAERDSAFAKLMRDADFAGFVRRRGKEPEPEPAQQGEAVTSETKTPQNSTGGRE